MGKALQLCKLIAMVAVAWCAVIAGASASEVASAHWISREGSSTTPSTLLFRRDFDLPGRVANFPVRISADDRFILYVNQIRVAAGPARGDLAHWRFERVDIAPYLRRGHNVVAVVVWNDGHSSPAAQISAHTGLWLEAENVDQAFLNTGDHWLVKRDSWRRVASPMASLMRQLGNTYYVAGAGETLDAAAHDWNWQSNSADASWSAAAILPDPTPHQLVASALPQMRYERIDSGRIVRTDFEPSRVFPRRQVQIPANARVRILIDAGRVLAAYPELIVSGGRGARISATYTEALYEGRERRGDRDQVGDRQAIGLSDTFIPDGGAHRTFAPLWWRAWRFVELDIQTGDEPLQLEQFNTFETGYPFEQRARFVSSDAELNEIWRIGWMTALFDAHETYMDTGYWEQLQYIGDTRIQALITYNVSGDARLPVQALDAFDHSRVIDGLPQAAYPSRTANSIPPFALLWIGMLHDYWMYNPDTEVLARNLPGARTVLDWYAPYVRENGMVRASEAWDFIDWAGDLAGVQPQSRPRNAPPRADSCIITMQYIGALDQSADLEAAIGEPGRVSALRARAAQSRAGVLAQCWDKERGLFADTPERNAFSQHANALAVLHDVAPSEQHQAILHRVVSPEAGISPSEGVTGTTYYFAFYLVQAYAHAGLADEYLGLLKTWRDLRALNFTTWPENPDPSRSDSHAWSAHPTIDLLTLVAGVQPGAPGFQTVRVAPHLGELWSVDADVPHPQGLIRTSYRRHGSNVSARIVLPANVTGVLVWQGRNFALRAGANRFRLEAHDGAGPSR